MSQHATLLVGDREIDLVVRVAEGRMFCDAGELAHATGWDHKPEGWCRGDVCVPGLGRASAVADDGMVDLELFGSLVGLPVAVDIEHLVAAIGTSSSELARSLDSQAAPQLTLPDLDGNPTALLDGSGNKRMIVAFASWCGCRYDLPVWQQRLDELGEHGFDVVAVAVDETPEDAAPWAEGVTFPVLLDRDRTFCDAYAVNNVPTVVWVDSNDQIVRPNEAAFGSDDFIEFHGVESGPYLDSLRRWVLDDELPYDPAEVAERRFLPNDDEQLARVMFRLGVCILRRGDQDAAAAWFTRAGELAPDDFTIRRAALPLVGDDPFGPRFFELYDDWKDRTGGRYYAPHPIDDTASHQPAPSA